MNTTNLTIIDKIFGIGENRKFDAYVSNSSELIIVDSTNN